MRLVRVAFQRCWCCFLKANGPSMSLSNALARYASRTRRTEAAAVAAEATGTQTVYSQFGWTCMSSVADVPIDEQWQQQQSIPIMIPSQHRIVSSVVSVVAQSSMSRVGAQQKAQKRFIYCRAIILQIFTVSIRQRAYSANRWRWGRWRQGKEARRIGGRCWCCCWWWWWSVINVIIINAIVIIIIVMIVIVFVHCGHQERQAEERE